MSVITPKYSFIRFDNSDIPLPYLKSDELSFQVVSDEEITGIRMTTISGDEIETATDIIFPVGNDVYFIAPRFTQNPDCFMIQLLSGNVVLGESNVFVKIAEKNEKYTSLLKYRCDGDEFKFVYCPPFVVNSVRLPIYLKEPQFTQNQTTYTQLDGRIRTTSATIGKEWQLETDYLSETIHNFLVIALCSDYVWINNYLLSKTGNFSIDWSNVLEKNEKDYTKGSCSMTENMVSRNSNCGSDCAGEDFEVYPMSLHFNAN